MAKLRKFILLIWKNSLLQIRHPWATFFELAFPTLFTVSLLVVRLNVMSEFISNSTVYPAFFVKPFPSNLTARNYVLYAPKLNHTSLVMDNIQTKSTLQITGYSSEEDLVSNYKNNVSIQSQVLAGVIFTSETSNSTTFSNNIDYKIRPCAVPSGSTSQLSSAKTQSWMTQFTFPLFQALGPREKDFAWGGKPGYMAQGFLFLQHIIDTTIIEILINNSISDSFTLEMQRYPYPPYDDDKFLLALQFFLPVVLILSFIYPALNITKNVVLEKERKLKESMKMMGLSNWLHWSAWFVKSFVFLSITTVIITAMISVKFSSNVAVLDKSDPAVIILILLVYMASSICFSFFISVFFSKANSAAAGAGIFFFMTFVPYFFIFPRYNKLTYMQKIASCLLSNTAVSMASMIISMHEGTGSGAQWYNLHEPASPDDSLTLYDIIIMLVIDGAIYLTFTWYLEAIIPGEYGIPQPWYFPFTRSYWCGIDPYSDDDMHLLSAEERHSAFFESEPSGLMIGIQMQGLTKVYKKKKPPVVKKLTMNMFRGQITALLGHNGAGKTTTISMLTGLIPPTFGTALVNGHDILEDTVGVHKDLGICPQHDVLFDDLTVKEHLYFFCKLKGYFPDVIHSEVNNMLHALDFEHKQNALAKTLSGGMKRKLSVGIALVGGSKVVLLDEPTSGMDPSARRFIWDLLQNEKEDRTILLTTHFMEEADILGDWIAIMADGEIQCCGSSLFLKKKYGAGYHMVIVKEPSCNVDVITEFIHSHLPEATLESNIGASLSYSIPHDQSSLFEKFFNEMEKKKLQLGISSYGASITTMEEVFLRVGQHTITAMEALKQERPPLAVLDSTIIPNQNSDNECIESNGENKIGTVLQRNTGHFLFFQQLWALLVKRALYSLRNWVLTISQLLLPPFFLAITLIVIKTLPTPENSPPLKLNLDPFQYTVIPYILESENNTFERAFKDRFLSQFTGRNVPYQVNGSLINHLIKDGESDIGFYNLHNIVAASFGFNDTKYRLKSLFNNQAYHSPAIALSAIDNALLKFFTENGNYSFSTTNHPLPRVLSEQANEQQVEATEAYQIAQGLVFGMSFLMASFAIFLVKERASKAKHLQQVSGVKLVVFWMATFIWDFMIYIIPSIFILLAFIGFQTEGMKSTKEQGRILLLLILHGLAGIPFIYNLSFLFMVSSTAYVTLCLSNMIFGIALLLTVTIMEIPRFELTATANILDWIFSLFLPNYCIGRAMMNLYQNYQFLKICTHFYVQALCFLKEPPLIIKSCCKDSCDKQCIPWQKNFFAWELDGIGRILAFLAIQCILYFFILAAYEVSIVQYIRYMLQRNVKPGIVRNVMIPQAPEDEDVINERRRILDTPLHDLLDTDTLIFKELTKYYGHILAVDKLTLGIHRGECFGLLGLNGAGKTTTFKMITGDEIVSSGNAYLDGFSIRNSIREVQQRVGYCPQYDALIDQLTGRENLTLFARLRGISEESIPMHIEKLSKLLYFDMHIDKQVKEYSGGSKRKLSTAIALIGDPPVAFLDEPTTGMDPVARRCLWDALLKVLDHGCSVILTSHSMEECEALCHRLVIMVNGQCYCLGSPQHLKNKFGQGFTLIVKVGRTFPQLCSSAAEYSNNELSEYSLGHVVGNTTQRTNERKIKSAQRVFLDKIDVVKKFIRETFPGCKVQEVTDACGLLHCHILDPQMNWGQIFGIMEKTKSTLGIEDYSIGQTTLEQVFLSFARGQRTSEHIYNENIIDEHL